MFDLKNLIPDDSPVVVHLKHPNTEEDLGMTITVASQHSTVYEDYLYEKVQERVSKGDTEEREYSLRELREQTTELYAQLTLEWTIVIDKKTPKVSANKAKEVYNKWKWVVPQIEQALAEREDFT